MHCDYSDIRDRLGKPLWFDEAGVPRYCDFHPARCANIYAMEAVLLVITCQMCHEEFRVAISRDDEKDPPLHALILKKELEYGDPPNACCDIGAPTSSEPHRVLEYWSRAHVQYEPPTWRRDDRFEVECVPWWV